MPRYPDISVELRTSHPLAWVAAVRSALRSAGVDRPEISSFSAEALASGSPESQRRVCAAWVTVQHQGREDDA